MRLPARLRYPLAALVAVALATAATVSVQAVTQPDETATEAPVAVRAADAGLRDVMWVGNNWDGTASIVDAHTFEVLKRGVNLIPDKRQETTDLLTDPVGLVFFLAVNVTAGQGHNQYVDDMFTTMDGRYLAVSRPSFADVVWFDVRKAVRGLPGAIVREQQMDGHRTDHMQVSNDGRRLLVSDSTAKQVIEYSMVDETLPDGTQVKMGDRLRTFPSGETPHESNYTLEGDRILHASIGRVYTPLDDTEPADGTLLGIPLARLGLTQLKFEELLSTLPWEVLDEAVKADRWLQYVDAGSFEILERWDMKRELAEAGFPGMSSAVRPVALHPDGRRLYLQVSFLHGIVEFDTEAADLNGTTDYTRGGEAEPATGAVKRIIPLENRVPSMPREQYVNDSAHHGIAISENGRTLCVAGTMDDYAALVNRARGTARYFDETTTGHGYGKPYWVTEGLNNTCWFSISDDDSVAVVSTDTKKEIAYLQVGNHPQRVRHGYVEDDLFPAAG